MDIDPEVKEFYDKHCAISGGVIVVLCDGVVEVFTSFELAIKYMQDTGRPCIATSCIVNSPDCGDVITRTMH